MLFTSWIFSHTAGEFHAVQVIAYHFGAIAAFGKVLWDNWLLFRHNVVLSMEHTKALSDHLLVEQEQRRKEAGEAARERALQLEVAEKEALLRTALDSMESGLLMYSAELELELVNDRLLEFLDIPPEFMQIGKSAVPAMEYFAARGGEQATSRRLTAPSSSRRTRAPPRAPVVARGARAGAAP